jgi:hypothetical protein
MGKHVPSGNLFPTVRTRRPTETRVYLSTERVPVYLPTDRRTDNDRTSPDASTVLLRFQPTNLTDTKLVCCEVVRASRNEVDLEGPRWHHSATDYRLCCSAYSPYRPTVVPICLLPQPTDYRLCRYAYSSTNDRADTPTIHRFLLAPYYHPIENDSAVMPAIYRPIDSSSSVFDLLSLLNACTVLLPEQTTAAPACS